MPKAITRKHDGGMQHIDSSHRLDSAHAPAVSAAAGGGGRLARIVRRRVRVAAAPRRRSGPCVLGTSPSARRSSVSRCSRGRGRTRGGGLDCRSRSGGGRGGRVVNIQHGFHLIVTARAVALLRPLTGAYCPSASTRYRKHGWGTAQCAVSAQSAHRCAEQQSTFVRSDGATLSGYMASDLVHD